MLGCGPATSCHFLQVHHRWIPSSLKLYPDHPQWRSKWYPWKVDLTLKWSCRMIQQCLGEMANKNGCRWYFGSFVLIWGGSGAIFVALALQFEVSFDLDWDSRFLFGVCATDGVVVFDSSIGLYLRMLKDDLSLAILCDLFWIVFLGILSKDVGDLQRSGLFFC